MSLDRTDVVVRGIADERPLHNDTSLVTSVQLQPWSSSAADNSNAVRNITVEPPVTPAVYDDPGLWHRCCGSDVSVASEHLSFYFSGMVGVTRVPLGMLSGYTDDNHPTVLTNDMVTCDTSDLNRLACSSVELPERVQPRAESGLVWLPIGRQGVLALVGGVEIPGDQYIMELPKMTPNGSFMTQIPLYDIATGSWYVQNASGDEIPPQTAAFCTTLGIAHDYSSFNIYVYGGYDGTYITDYNAYDTVWVLSLPSFRWIKTYDPGPESVHGRQNHQCISPYPNQMLTIGGNSMLGSSLTSPNIVDVFDMNELSWTSVYDPLNWSEYEVPKKFRM